MADGRQLQESWGLPVSDLDSVRIAHD